MVDDYKPYGPVRYGPKSPSWAEKDRKQRAGQEIRDEKFIQAIMEESRKNGKPLSHDQARRELTSQQRLSQKEVMWQEHRDTLEEYPTGEARRPEGPVHKQKITKKMAGPVESENEKLKRENKELRDLVDSLKETVRDQNIRLRTIEKEMMK